MWSRLTYPAVGPKYLASPSPGDRAVDGVDPEQVDAAQQERDHGGLDLDAARIADGGDRGMVLARGCLPHPNGRYVPTRPAHPNHGLEVFRILALLVHDDDGGTGGGIIAKHA